jgi:hypothetical protein
MLFRIRRRFHRLSSIKATRTRISLTTQARFRTTVPSPIYERNNRSRVMGRKIADDLALLTRNVLLHSRRLPVLKYETDDKQRPWRHPHKSRASGRIAYKSSLQ